MLINFFFGLKHAGIPVTIRELLDLLAVLQHRLVFSDTETFYVLSRAVLVKDEKYYDKFDKAFGLYFKDLEDVSDNIDALIPD